MPSVKPESVDAYIAAQPAEVREILKEVRMCIRKALPKADEVISYGIPAYRLQNRIALYFAGWKKHYAIYPVTAPMAQALKEKLRGHDLSGRGTIRLPFDGRVPKQLIGQMARFRSSEIGASEKLEPPAQLSHNLPNRRAGRRVAE